MNSGVPLLDGMELLRQRTDIAIGKVAVKLVTYLQETANEHLIHIGISLDELRDRYGLAFILGSISKQTVPLKTGKKILGNSNVY